MTKQNIEGFAKGHALNQEIKSNRAESLVGALFEVNDGLVQVIEYSGNKRVLVRFIESGYSCVTTMVNIKAKQVKDKFKKTICGVGYIGEGITIKGEERRKLYMVWRNMLIRLTDTENFPTYADVEIDPRWYCFAEFAHDVAKLPGYERFMTERDISLDKDIRNPGAKCYCAQNCQWISKSENTLEMLERKRGSVKAEIIKPAFIRVNKPSLVSADQVQW